MREETPNDKRLVAYVVCAATAPAFDEAATRAALKKTLPDYMVPNVIVSLNALPRTENGKLDRRALPAPKAAENFVPPKTSLEQKLALIWAAVLGVERVGLSDNFFELGGHSLVALRLVNRLREVLGEHLSLVLVFEAPTVGAMALSLQTTCRSAVARWIEESSSTQEPAPNDKTTATILPFALEKPLPGTASRPMVPVLRPLPAVVPINRDSRRARRPVKQTGSHE